MMISTPILAKTLNPRVTIIMEKAARDLTRLFVRKFPGWLQAKDKESLLRYFGANEVTVMADKGMMRNSAFAQFSNSEEAKVAMMKLHQLEVFNCRLVVTYATARDTKQGSVHDGWGCDALNSKAKSSDSPKTDTRFLVEPSSLSYLYPPPNQLIISNIANAISCVPNLYVQVLHLMNRMNLPPPFGGPSPAASNLAPPPGEQMSSGESEIEESDDDKRNARLRVAQVKRTKRGMKRQFNSSKQILENAPPSKAYRLDEAFPDYAIQKRLEINVPEELHTHSYVTGNIEKIYQIPEASQVNTNIQVSSSSVQAANDAIPIIVTEELEHFLPASELECNRMSKEEMRTLNVFKNYKPGDQSMRLYVKNLSKHVSEKDLKYVYGRYIDWNNENHVNSFDIRVMQQGRMKGQAFVGMPSEDLALQALQDTNGYLLQGKPLVVQFARSTKAKETDQIMIESLSKQE